MNSIKLALGLLIIGKISPILSPAFAQPPPNSKPSSHLPDLKPGMNSFMKTFQDDQDQKIAACIPSLKQFKNQLSPKPEQVKKLEYMKDGLWKFEAANYGFKCQYGDLTNDQKTKIAAEKLNRFLKSLNSRDREHMKFLLSEGRMEHALKFYSGIAKKEALIMGTEKLVQGMAHRALITEGSALTIEKTLGRLGVVGLVLSISLELRGDTPIHREIYQNGMDGELNASAKALVLRYNENVLAPLADLFNNHETYFKNQLHRIEEFLISPIADDAEAKKLCTDFVGYQGNWMLECTNSLASWLKLSPNAITEFDKKNAIQLPDNTSKAIHGQSTTGGW